MGLWQRATSFRCATGLCILMIIGSLGCKEKDSLSSAVNCIDSEAINCADENISDSDDTSIGESEVSLELEDPKDPKEPKEPKEPRQISGHGLFTCHGDFCYIVCDGETVANLLQKGESGFCTDIISNSGNVRGTYVSHLIDRNEASKDDIAQAVGVTFILADYQKGSSSFVKAKSSFVEASLSCDVTFMDNNRSSSTLFGNIRHYSFGRDECYYEATGLNEQPVRVPIVVGGVVQFQRGVRYNLTNDGIDLNHGLFFPFVSLNKDTTVRNLIKTQFEIDGFTYDAYESDGNILTKWFSRLSVYTREEIYLGRSRVTEKFWANQRWTAVEH